MINCKTSGTNFINDHLIFDQKIEFGLFNTTKNYFRGNIDSITTIHFSQYVANDTQYCLFFLMFFLDFHWNSPPLKLLHSVNLDVYFNLYVSLLLIIYLFWSLYDSIAYYSNILIFRLVYCKPCQLRQQLQLRSSCQGLLISLGACMRWFHCLDAN